MRRLLALSLLLCAAPSFAATFPTSWTPVSINPGDGGTAYLGDPRGDGQNNGRDIVGDQANPAFFVASDATHFFFRIRVDVTPLQAVDNLAPYGWGILIDSDGDVRDYDYLLMVNGITETLDYRKKTTKTLAGDPSEVADVTLSSVPLVYTAGATQNVRVLAAGSSIGGTPDFFIDVAIPLTTFYGTNPDGGAALNFTPSTPLRFWVGVSNSSQSIQTDLGGTLLSPGPGVLPGTVTDPVVLCTSDTTCGSTTSGSICVTGACVPGCRGTGGNGCPGGFTCSSIDATPGVCNAVPPPPAPVVTTPANGALVATSTPTVSGSATAGTTVKVYVDGLLVGSTVVPGTGLWSLALATGLTDGAHTVRATATNAGGATSANSNTNTFTVDTTPPAAPVVTAPANGSSTSASSTTVTGTAEANSTVSVTVDGSVVGTTTTNGAGAWSFVVPGTLAEGSHTVSATARDAAGNTSAPSATNTFTVDRTAPAAPVVSTPADGSSTASTTPTVTGTAEANSTVTVRIDGSAVGTATTNGAGAWSFVVPSALTQGSHTVSVTARDAAGNTSGASNTNTFTVDTTPPSAPVVTAPANGSSTSATSPTVTGTAEANSTVSVTIDGSVVGTATTNGAGAWSFVVPSTLTAGSHTVSATAADAAGNTSAPSATNTFTVDTTPPAAPVVTAPANGSTIAATSPTVTGTAEANSTVTVRIDGNVVGTTTADGAGAWSFVVPSTLSAGSHTVSATAADAAGNISGASNTNTFTVDPSIPAAPSITTPASGSATNDTTPLVSGSAPANSTVRVFVDGAGAPDCTATASATGAWSCSLTTALAAGAHSVAATAAGANGVPSALSTANTFTVDVTAPVAPVVTAPSNGSALATSTPTVTGTAEAGSTVTVFVDGSSTPACTATASGTGAWSCQVSPSLTDGAHTVTATATDAAGNASAPATTVSFTVDTATPAAPTITSPLTGSVVRSGTPPLTGTAEAGSTVTVFLDGSSTPACTVIATSSGDWSCTLTTALTDGAHLAVARATDAAGNVSTPAVSTFSVDTAAPAAPALLAPLQGATTSAFPTFSGTAEPGSTVRVLVDGASTPACTATASATGTFTCVAGSALSAGAHAATATATDAAGNLSPASAARDFTVGAAQLPGSPVVTAPVAGSATADTTPTVSGNAEPGSTVRVFLDGGTTPSCTATADAQGRFSCDVAPALTEGVHTLVATASTTTGTSGPSTAIAFTVDTTAPTAPVITAPTANATTGVRPLVSGTAEAGAVVRVFADGSTTAACTATADASGLWACAPGADLAAGSHSVTAQATDAAGNTGPASAAVAFTVVVGQAPSAPVVTHPAPNAVLSDGTPEFRGVAAPLSQVTVTVDGSSTPACTTTADATGRFACSPAANLTDGSHSVTATATDGAGTSPASAAVPFRIDTMAPAVPVITSPVANAMTDRLPTVTGTAEANSTVVVRIDGLVICEVAANAQGQWSCATTQPLPPGAHEATATAVDAAGNASAPSAPVGFTVLGTPRAPALQQPANGSSTTDTTPTYVGVAEPNSQVTVRVDGNVACTTTASGTGAFSCTPTTALGLGTHQVQVTNETAGGSAVSPMTSFQVVLAAPGAPTLTSPNSGQRTSDTTPTFSGTAEPGTTVKVLVDGMEVCSATAGSDGRFSCASTTPLAAGDHSATATATGPGGTSTPSSAVPFTVTVTPPIITTPAPDEKTPPQPVVTGTATPGSTVTVLVNGDVACTTTAAADGTYSCRPDSPLPEGDGTIVVRTVDSEGTTLESAPRSFRVPERLLRGAGIGCTAVGDGPGLWALLALLAAVWLRRSPRLARAATTAAAVAVVAGAGLAQAQTTPVPGFELERVRLNAGARHGLLVDSADLLSRFEYRAALTLHYQHDPLVMMLDGQRAGSIVRGRFGAHLSGAFGITEWLEVGLQLPLVLAQGGDDLSSQGVTPVSQAVSVGTSWLSARVAPFQQSRGAPLDAALGVALGIPLGTAESFTGDPGVSVAPTLSVGRGLKGLFGGGFADALRVGASLGVLVRPTRALSPSATTVRDEVGSAFNAGFIVSTVGPALRVELSGRLDVPFTRTGAGGEAWLGVRYPLFKLLEVYAVAGPGFGSQPGTPSFRVLAGIALAPRPAVEAPPPAPRCVAGTPHVPAECPELDLDGDGITNGADRCPELAGVASRAGCADVDTDGDGLLDGQDRCPAVAGLAALEGCLPPDADADGFPDAKDACPAAAAKGSARGCPDTDGDGFDDAADKCPAQAGVEELKGCPDTDTDGDGVVDRLDACKAEPGPAKNQGCPAKQKQLVAISKDRLVISDKVYFATGKSQVLARSATLLQQIARVLREHPEVERVSIEGHTDDRGNHDANMKLSRDRAESVRQFLLGLGIEAGRMTSAGFGPDRPLQPNTSAAGREANRRVDFVIIGAETTTAPAPVTP